MSDTQRSYTSQQKLIAALRDPRRYPQTVKTVQVIETHISWVLLAGRYAYKIKKALDLGYFWITPGWTHGSHIAPRRSGSTGAPRPTSMSMSCLSVAARTTRSSALSRQSSTRSGCVGLRPRT